MSQRSVSVEIKGISRILEGFYVAEIKRKKQARAWNKAAFNIAEKGSADTTFL